ncbi:ABC transporter substrate-binding protein [Planomonospora sp. ID82291]|uniref:ABC transporter substrate-binding protein n=1 Tax=Planomonospora sp. ID82291 TaxID=2738136 RepID=UPI0018C3B34A|nr:ABC transporter substrate-binding protein [Planomonospora sp. ID82291]MBG0816786.1 ABC transporter substrate-binding protein [Planomonospora sp. ID82291]
MRISPKPRTAALAGLLLALTTAGCGAGPASPASPTAPASAASAAPVKVESCGHDLSFARPPQRVVTLDQSSTETLLALGLQDRMAGTSNLKTKVAAQYQSAYGTVPVLNPKLLTAEQLRAATPDLVVSSFTDLYTKDRVGTREELRRLGLPSYVSAVDCPEGGGSGRTPFDLLLRDYENLGRIFRVEDRAAKLIAEQRQALDRAADVRSSVTGEPTVVWLYSVYAGLPYVAGNGGMPSAMSELVGVRNAFDDVDEDWPEVSWEEIARRDPDIIVIGDLSERGAAGDSAAEKLAMLREEPTMSKLTAVKENRIVQVPGIEMDPSVRTVNTLGLFADGLRKLGHVR